MDLTTHAMLRVGFVTIIGAALGGAIAHRRRGSGHILTGAIIGVPARLRRDRYAGIIGALGVLALAVLVVGGWLFG